MNKAVFLGVFVVIAAYLLVVAPRDAKIDAQHRDMMPPLSGRQYLSTPEVFIGNCGKPIRVRDGVLDYGTVLVSFRPAADGLAAHFYESDGVTEIAGEIGLKRLGCTL